MDTSMTKALRPLPLEASMVEALTLRRARTGRSSAAPWPPRQAAGPRRARSTPSRSRACTARRSSGAPRPPRRSDRRPPASGSGDRRGDVGGERVDVLRGRVPRAHPAHLAGRLVPRRRSGSAPAGASATLGWQDREDGVGLRPGWVSSHAGDRRHARRPAARHRVGVRGAARATGRPRAAPRTARRGSASSRRAASYCLRR